jgi:DNA-binding response OmpR family regulator
MRTILIVDDEKNVRSSLGTTFRLEGYAVETAEDGRSAIAAVEGGGIDAVVLDLQMPGLDGYETLRELRRRDARVPVVFLTAHGSVERAVEALRLDAGAVRADLAHGPDAGARPDPRRERHG